EHQIVQLRANVVHGNRMAQVDTPLETLLQAVPELENLQHPGSQLFRHRYQLNATPGSTGLQLLRTARQGTARCQTGTVDRGQQQILGQLLLSAEIPVVDRRFLRGRQFLPQILDLLRQALQQQALNPVPVRLRGLQRVVEQLLNDR